MSRTFHRLAAVAAAAALLVLVPSAALAAPADRPAAPTSVAIGGVACVPGGIFVGSTSPRVTATFTNPDLGRPLTPTFALWPAGHREQRVEWTAAEWYGSGTVFTTLPAALTNGGKYRLAARAVDSNGVKSPWSDGCAFTVDTLVPHAPVVTSTDYPEDVGSVGPGVPGRFTFAVAGGDKDVVKFRYSSSDVSLTEVPVGRKGRVTVEITPSRAGLNSLTVEAIDRTGNHSAPTTYDFTVARPEPAILDETQEDPEIGVPRTIRFFSAVRGTESFTYRLNDDPPATVPAGTDGWATATVTPERRGDNILRVTSRTTTGVVSPESRYNLYVQVRVPLPMITSPDFPGDGTPPPTVGQEVTINFRTDSPEVTEFTYSADFGATEQTIAADQHGNATFRHTTSGVPYLEVRARARTADGFESFLVYAGWELTPATS